MKFVVALIRNPRWIAATAGNGAGYALQVAALAFGSVLIVAPIIVTSLLFALPLGAFLSHRKLPMTVAAFGLVLAVSLAVFVTLGNASEGVSRASPGSWLIVSAIGAPLLAACLGAAQPRSGSSRASLLAIAVGVLAGGLAVLTKSVVASAEHGLLAVLSTGETYALVLVGAAGIYLQQLSFQAGALQASLPIMTVLEPVVAAVLGLALLHEKLQVSGWQDGVLALAVVGMLVSTIALARVRAQTGG